MRLRGLWVVGFAAVTCVSPPDLVYLCEKDGTCPTGRQCCADGFCREACGAAGGGSATGGGNAGAGGGASDGGGTANLGGGTAASGGGTAATGGGTAATGGGSAATGGGGAASGGGTSNGGGAAAGGGAQNCDPGGPCTTNPNPCHVGVMDCSGATGSCADGMSLRPRSFPCGTNGTCDDTGNCIVCAANGMPCPAGVCWSGSCVACPVGTSCTTNPSDPCRTGVRHFDAGVCSCDDDAVAPGQCDQGLCIDGLCCGGLSCSYAGTCVDGRSVNHCGNNGNTCFPCAPNLLCCSTGTTNYCALSCM